MDAQFHCNSCILYRIFIFLVHFLRVKVYLSCFCLAFLFYFILCSFVYAYLPKFWELCEEPGFNLKNGKYHGCN